MVKFRKKLTIFKSDVSNRYPPGPTKKNYQKTLFNVSIKKTKINGKVLQRNLPFLNPNASNRYLRRTYKK